MPNEPEASASSASPTETYTLANQVGSNVMAQRTAHARPSFLQPYPSTGMKLRDAGCGPGSITVGPAEVKS